MKQGAASMPSSLRDESEPIRSVQPRESRLPAVPTRAPLGVRTRRRDGRRNDARVEREVCLRKSAHKH